jgi:hypothetical protein
VIILKKKSRLKKLSGDGMSVDYPITNFFNNFFEKIDNKDKITNITQGPFISREFEFIKDRTNPEWALQSSYKEKEKREK